MQEHHIGVSRTARYFTLGDCSPGVGEVWFVCHGYGQLASRFLEKLRVLDDGRRYLLAPEGLSRFYLSESPTERRVGARTGTAPPGPRDSAAHRRARAASRGIATRAGRTRDTQTRPPQPPASSRPT